MAKVALDIQMARCALTLLVMGKAMLLMPDNLEVSGKIQATYYRLSEWHNRASKEIAVKPGRVGLASSFTLNRKLAVYDRLVGNCRRNIRHAAGFWASVLMLWDARNSCRDVARTRAWHMLDVTSEAFARWLLSRCDNADVTGDDIYLGVAW